MLMDDAVCLPIPDGRNADRYHPSKAAWPRERVDALLMLTALTAFAIA